MDTGDGRRLEIEADSPAAAVAFANSWAAENPYTRSESSSMAGMLPAGAEIAPTEVRSLPEQAAIIPQGIAGFGSGVAQTATGIGELAPGQLGEAAARATQYLQSVGAPEMQTAGRIAGSIAPGAAAMRGVQALGSGVRALAPGMFQGGAVSGLGTVAGGTIGGGASGLATGFSTPTGIEDREQRMAKKSEAATTEGLLGAGLGFGLSAVPQAILAAQAIRPSQGRFVAERMQGITPQQFNEAEALSQEAERLGVRITAPEALQAVTQGGTSLGALQRRLETSPGGEQLFSQFMASRPQQTQRAVSGLLDEIAPPTTTPSLLEAQTRRAAEDIRTAPIEARSAAMRPDLDLMEGTRVDPQSVKELVGGIRKLAAAKDETGRIIAPGLQQLESLLIKSPAVPETVIPRRLSESGTFYLPAQRLPGKPEEYVTDANTLSAIYQQVGDLISPKSYAAEGLSRYQQGVLKPELKKLSQLLKSQVEPYKQAMETGERLSRRLEEFNVSPSGRLAQAESLSGQQAVMLPEGQALQAGQENEIARLFGSMGELARPNIRQQLANVANRTAGQLTSAGLPNQYAGAAFAAALQRNPQYQRNLTAAMQASGVPPQPMSSLLDVLQATGYRQRPGSATASNLAEKEAMSALGLGGVRQAVAAPLRTISQAFARQNQEEVTRNLSQIALSGPEGIRTLQRMAQNAGLEGETARRILRSRNIAVPGILGAVGE
jgi:hypothetical protein